MKLEEHGAAGVAGKRSKARKGFSDKAKANSGSWRNQAERNMIIMKVTEFTGVNTGLRFKEDGTRSEVRGQEE